MEEKYDIILDEYVIMPDHVHFLIFIKSERATARVAPTYFGQNIFPFFCAYGYKKSSAF